MVEADADYVFEGPDGEVTLLDLFEGRRQLIVYHFMFGPDWEAGCAFHRCTPTDTNCERSVMTTSPSGRATPGRPP